MKIKLYYEIVKDIYDFHGLTRDCADMLIQKYPTVSSQALHSILSSETVCRLKSNKKNLYGVDYLAKYMESRRKGEPPGIIIRLAADADLPPTFVSRHILHKYYKTTEENTSRSVISRFLKNPSLLQDANLAYEISLSTLYDDRNGFISDAFCLSIGHEYEIKLQKELEDRNVAYKTEDELRRHGYDKTPDVKLDIPIAVDGCVINWIESKARFGTPQVHKTHIEEQFLSYWNRFGPGLIIYWFGFVDEIVDQNEKKFIILDHFPENIIYMNPSSIQTLS